jgi:hypothetical protein
MKKTRTLVFAAGAALAIKLVLALFTVGTNDSLTWDHDLAKLKTAGAARLYREGVQYSSPSGRLYPRQDFIHPPAVVNGLRGLGILQDVSGLPLRFWLRLACALADIGTLTLVWLMFPSMRDGHLLKLMALSPISILVSGFHANTDPIMTFFVVLSVFFLERGRISLGGAAFGIAACVKVVPIIFVPAILLYLPGLRERAKWAGFAAGAWITASMPYFAQNPGLILQTIGRYQSSTGLWGFFMLSSLLKGSAFEALHTVYAPAAKWIALLSVVSCPLALRHLRVRLSLFVQCGIIVFVFLFLSSGFGLQYLAWTVPWVVAVGTKPMATYYSAAGACLLTVYIAAAGEIGINAYADVFNVSIPMRIFVRLVCWAAIGGIAWQYARLAAAARTPCQTDSTVSSPRCRRNIAMIATQATNTPAEAAGASEYRIR